MVKLSVALGAALLCLAGGTLIGRYTTPTKTVEKLVTIEKTVEVQSKQHEESHREDQIALTNEVVKWKIKEVFRGGTVVRTAEGETGRSSEQETRKADSKREVEIKYVDREKLVEKIKVVEASKAQWAVSAGAGFSTGLAPVYRGQVERRIIGPFWLGAWADTSKSAGLAVRVEW